MSIDLTGPFETSTDCDQCKLLSEVGRLRFTLAVKTRVIDTSALSDAQLRANRQVMKSICDAPRTEWGPLRCLLSEGSDGDTYAGCILDECHDGRCQMKARPEHHRAAEAAEVTV